MAEGFGCMTSSRQMSVKTSVKSVEKPQRLLRVASLILSMEVPGYEKICCRFLNIDVMMVRFASNSAFSFAYTSVYQGVTLRDCCLDSSPSEEPEFSSPSSINWSLGPLQKKFALIFQFKIDLLSVSISWRLCSCLFRNSKCVNSLLLGVNPGLHIQLITFSS